MSHKMFDVDQKKCFPESDVEQNANLFFSKKRKKNVNLMSSKKNILPMLVVSTMFSPTLFRFITKVESTLFKINQGKTRLFCFGGKKLQNIVSHHCFCERTHLFQKSKIFAMFTFSTVSFHSNIS
jgi:hypothetical protein